MFVTYLFATNMFVILELWETGSARIGAGGIGPRNPH